MSNRLSGSDFAATLRNVAIDPRNDAVPVHRGAGVLRGDEDVGLTRFFRNEKTKTCLVDRQFAGHQIRFGRKDVTILPNPDDLAGALEFAQSLPDFDTLPPFASKRLGDLVAILWPIIGCAQQPENLFSNCASIIAHTGETILEDVDLTMKRIIAIGCTFAAAALVVFGAGGGKMKITSSAFQEGGTIPEKFSKNGQNVSPELRIEGAPAEAKSLALIVDDPDAPLGLFTHWLVWNIDSKTTEIAENSVPKGVVQGANDYPNLGYGGPQPPSGTHRYYFKIFALDRTLDLKSGAKRRELDAAMRGHIVGQGELMGRYSKK